MTCDAAKRTIQDSLDGRLDQSKREILDAHLSVCASCRAEWEAQRRLAGLADRWVRRSVTLSDPGDVFTAQVMARLETPPPPVRLSYLLPLTATLLLAAALAVIPTVPLVHSAQPLRALAEMPVWLQTNLSALASDARTFMHPTQALLLPSWTGTLLTAAAALNGILCLYVRQSARQRSVS